VLHLLELGAGSPCALHWVALLIVYFAHAAIWTLAATLLRVGLRRPSIECSLWKLALVGPLLTSAASGLTGLAARTQPSTFSSTSSLESSTGIAASAASEVSWTLANGTATAWLPTLMLALITVGLLRFLLSFVRLRRALRGRGPVEDARLRARFAALSERMGPAGVRFSESDLAPGPLVVGRREVCIPRGLLLTFTDAEVDAALAHELAHLERGDGFWFPLIGLIEAALWMQPLNHWVSARCRESAELAADDRAIEVTRAPLELARALARMAEVLGEAPRERLAPSLVSIEPMALQRVRRLVRHEAPLCACRDSATHRVACHAPVLGLVVFGFLSSYVHADVAHNPIAAKAPASTRTERPSSPAQRAYADGLEELEQNLASLQSAPDTERDAERALELEQALRHARAIREWEARSFAGGSSSEE
jgi:beta-lactamase regulating signal transducer with metallopeptidase domain